jgi:hypothetical protein
MGGENGETHEGLSDFELKVYGRSGLSEVDARKWKAAGVGPYPTQRFIELGISWEDAAVATAAGYGPSETKVLLDAGIPPHEFAKWPARLGSADDVMWARDRGIDSEEFELLERRFSKLEGHGATRVECRAWYDDQVDVDEIERTLEGGESIEFVRKNLPILMATSDELTRRHWMLLGKYVKVTSEILESGYRPVEILWGEQTHSADFEPPELTFDVASNSMRRVDGGELPSALMQLKIHKNTISDFISLGCRIRVEDSRNDALSNELGSIIIDFDVMVKTPGSKRMVKERRSIALVGSEPGEWTIVDFRPFEAVDRSRHSSIHKAIDAACNQFEVDKSIIRGFESRTFNASQILEHVIDRPVLLRGKTVRINDRTTKVKKRRSGEFFLSLTALASWPDYRKVNDHLFVVGSLGFAVDRDGEQIGLGTDSDLESSARLRIPAIEKVETKVDGKVQRVRVWSRPEGGYALEVEGRPRIPLVGLSLPDAFASSVELRTLRGDRLTWLSTSPFESFSIRDALHVIEVTNLEVSPQELVSYVDDYEDLPEWAVQYVDYSGWVGLDYLPAQFDGLQIAKVCPEGATPALILTEDLEEGGAPLDLNEWIFYGWGETASMVSGYWRRTVAIIAPGVLADLDDPDEGDDEVAIETVNESDRLEYITDWVLLGRAMYGIDLAMMAAEMLCGDDTFLWSSSYAFAAEFDDYASETLECDLRIDVRSDEVETFLQAIRDGGRPDVYDALRTPGSDAWNRRQARIRQFSPGNEDIQYPESDVSVDELLAQIVLLNNVDNGSGCSLEVMSVDNGVLLVRELELDDDGNLTGHELSRAMSLAEYLTRLIELRQGSSEFEVTGITDDEFAVVLNDSRHISLISHFVTDLDRLKINDERFEICNGKLRRGRDID